MMDNFSKDREPLKLENYRMERLSSIYRINYDYDYNEPDSFFQAEATFTVLSWLILDLIIFEVDFNQVDHN